MVTISLEEVEEDATGLLRRVEQGESFTVARDGKVVGTFQPASQQLDGRFRLGALEGKGVIPEDIKKPYEAEVDEMFYGK